MADKAVGDKKTPLKKIPGFSEGVRENSAVRMVKLNQPICPYSKVKMERTPEGRYIPAEDQGPVQNCQKADGEWWKDCEARGHDPYFRTRVWYTNQDTFETDPETGEDILTGKRTVRHKERVPNVCQVYLGTRVNSGRGGWFSIVKKGRRRLTEAGYEEVCQYRNCQRPISKNGLGGRFGNYCSKDHLALVAADLQGIDLHQVTGILEEGSEDKIAQYRAKELREAVAFVGEGS